MYTLTLLWEMRSEFVFGKTCGRGINRCVHSFPRLYTVVTVRDFSILAIYGNASSLAWNLIFLRNLTGSEIEDLEELMTSLTRVHLSTSIPDVRAGTLDFSSLFLVKSFFLALSKSSVPFHPANFIWKSKVSSKVKAFAWLVAHKKVNTDYLL